VSHPSSRRRPLLKAAVGGAAAVGAIAAAARSGLITGDSPATRGRLLQLSSDDGSDVESLEVPLGDTLLPHVGRGLWASAHLPTSTHSMVGFVWPLGSTEPEVEISSRQNGAWSPWQAVPVMHDVPDLDDPERSDRAGTEAVWVGPADGIQVRVSGERPAGLVLVLLHPRATASDAAAAKDDGEALLGDLSARSAAPGQLPPRPHMRGRHQWGANESWRDGSPRYNRTIQQVHIHHTANSNGYGRGDVPSILRGIYRYHTKSLGWSDIAYNFLVDRFGRIWVGRAGGASRPVRGAHTLGFNGTSTGIAVIGNFQVAKPDAEVLASLVKLASWKLAPFHRDPEALARVWSEGSDKFRWGMTVDLPVIDGHRDTNDTECPGNHLYAHIPAVRETAKQRIYDFAHPTIALLTPFGLSGDPVVGGELTVTPGSYTPPDAQLTYIWLRDGKRVHASLRPTHTLTAKDLGHRIAVRVKLRSQGWEPNHDRIAGSDPVQTQSDVEVTSYAQHGNVWVRAVVTAPGVRRPTGRVRVLLDGRRSRTRLLRDGTVRVRFRDAGAGKHHVQVVYDGDGDLVRGSSARRSVEVRH
jgi:hypothetical protein